jgi:hypothetical protein
VWDWAIYGALLVGFLAGSAAIGYLVVCMLEGWRAFKRFRRGLGRELERLADLGEATAGKLETASDTREVEESVSRLRVDLARLAVLREALDEVEDTVQRYAVVIPRR